MRYFRRLRACADPHEPLLRGVPERGALHGGDAGAGEHADSGHGGAHEVHDAADGVLLDDGRHHRDEPRQPDLRLRAHAGRDAAERDRALALLRLHPAAGRYVGSHAKDRFSTC